LDEWDKVSGLSNDEIEVRIKLINELREAEAEVEA
jgi:hypothetical protein